MSHFDELPIDPPVPLSARFVIVSVRMTGYVTATYFGGRGCFVVVCATVRDQQNDVTFSSSSVFVYSTDDGVAVSKVDRLCVCVCVCEVCVFR